MPLFDRDRLAFWSINRSDQSDIGGATHGACNPGAPEIWQEAIRLPPLRVYEAGRLRNDGLDLIVLNVRHPSEFRGDLAAMIGSARVGERHLAALREEFGPGDRARRDRSRAGRLGTQVRRDRRLAGGVYLD